MIMNPIIRVVQCHKNEFVTYKAAVDKWIIKVIYGHYKVIDAQPLTKIDFTCQNLLTIPLILAKSPHFENPVIHESSCIDFSIFILLNFLEFDIGSFEALFELDMVSL